MMKKYTAFVLAVLISTLAWTQEKIQKTFFGLEYKPIFENDFFTSGPNFGFSDNLTYELENISGNSFGMVLRHNFYGKLSFETGINSITRNYRLILTEDTTDFEVEDRFKMVSYEIPLLALIYVQASDNIFINAGTGISFNFLPRDLVSFDETYQQSARRTGWLKNALLAQVGAEYRTKESGIFYIGSSFHLPLSDLAQSTAEKRQSGNRPRVSADMSGRFLTLSLRYFFGPSTKAKAAQ